jgi:hypothetical protein
MNMRISVSANNLITGQKYHQFYSSMDDANNWINEMIALGAIGNGWGWGARIIYKTDGEGKPVTLGSEYDPLIIEETSEYWSLKAEYEYVTEDLTSEEIVEQQELDDYNETIQQMKAAVDTIDSWTSLNDINLTFLKKFFKAIIADMKERTTLN